MTTDCPNDDELLQFADGSLDGVARDRLTEHLGACRDCRHLLVLMQIPSEAESGIATPGGTTPRTTAGRRRPAEESVRIGRFVLLRRLGAGGMGAVYAAYDEQLDRRVAVKLMLHEATAATQARVEHEARAMARLTHPNVVHVYEVGHDGGELFIAMEFVQGVTLAQWQENRGWEEVLHAYRQAGDGLAAAHAAGLVHRDFKPYNVMVETSTSDTPRVKVLDFGLALRADSDLHDTRHDLEPESSTPHPTNPRLTAEGGLLGTPAYMAPEQSLSSDVTSAADQFSFCVSLWEAWYGQRPFEGASSSSLLDAVHRQALRDPPADTKVPPRLHRIIIRGLAASPEERWPSMQALLDALEHNASQRRRPVMAAGAFMLASAAAVAVLASSMASDPACTGAVERLHDAWGDARRAEIQSAMQGTHVPFAGRVWERTETQLGGYADQWRAMHTSVCEATTVRREQSEAVMDLRMACLHRAEVELTVISGVLARADAEVIENADALLEGLHPLSRCEDVAALQAEVEPPRAEEAQAVEEIRARLAEANAERRAGRYAEAEQRIDDAMQRIADVEYEPVHTQLALARGELLSEQGDYPAAVLALEHALGSAARSQQWRSMATATSGLLHVLGSRQHKIEQALRYRALAEGLVSGDTLMEAEVLDRIATILVAQARFAEAEGKLRRAQTLVVEAFGPDHPRLATLHDHLGGVLHKRGSYPEAEAEIRKGLAMREQELGPDHPSVASIRNNLARSLAAQGLHTAAESEHRLARRMVEQAWGPDHPDVARFSVSLASILTAQGKYEEAEVELRRAHTMLLQRLGPDHPDVAAPLTNLGSALAAQGKLKEAEVELRAALEFLERALEPDHPGVAKARSNVATMLAAQGKSAEAEPELRQALAAWVQVLGPDHPEVASAHINLGNLLNDMGRYDEAAAEHHRALTIREQALGPNHPSVAQAHLNLGTDLYASGDKQGAEKEFRSALVAWTHALGPNHPDVAAAHSNIASVLFEQEKFEEAEVELRLAIDALAPAMPDHPELARWRTNLARLLMVDERSAEALELAELAWARAQRGDMLAPDRASAAFVLAEILWLVDGPKHRERAPAIAEQALRAYQEVGEQPAIDAVQAWLEEHGVDREE